MGKGYLRHLTCAIESSYENTIIILDMEGRCSKDNIIREWKTKSKPEIQIKEMVALNTLLFADDKL
jgi:hypothetical protein